MFDLLGQAAIIYMVSFVVSGCLVAVSVVWITEWLSERTLGDA